MKDSAIRGPFPPMISGWAVSPAIISQCLLTFAMACGAVESCRTGQTVELSRSLEQLP